MSAPDIEALSARLTGHRFPGGELVLKPHEAWLGDDAMQSAQRGTAGNPLWFLVVALRGMGLTIGELVELADTTMAGGVLFGELTVDQAAPLQPGRRYRVDGGIESIIRREGRSGVFDVLTFRLDIAADGAVAGTVTSSFILSRRSA